MSIKESPVSISPRYYRFFVSTLTKRAICADLLSLSNKWFPCAVGKHYEVDRFSFIKGKISVPQSTPYEIFKGGVTVLVGLSPIFFIFRFFAYRSAIWPLLTPCDLYQGIDKSLQDGVLRFPPAEVKKFWVFRLDEPNLGTILKWKYRLFIWKVMPLYTVTPPLIRDHEHTIYEDFLCGWPTCNI